MATGMSRFTRDEGDGSFIPEDRSLAPGCSSVSPIEKFFPIFPHGSVETQCDFQASLFMDIHVTISFALDKIEMLLAMPLAELWLAKVFLGLAAYIYAIGIPGALVPVSFSSDALLGETLAIAAGAAGALFGSVILFCGLARGTNSISQHRYGRHIERLDHVVARAALYVALAEPNMKSCVSIAKPGAIHAVSPPVPARRDQFFTSFVSPRLRGTQPQGIFSSGSGRTE